MTSDEFFAERLASVPLIAIFRAMARDRTLELCRQVWSVGVPLVEVPIQGAEAVETFRAVVAAGHAAGHPVGAGTVLTPDQIDLVVEAGGDYAVAPGFDPEVIARADAAGLPFLPGVATPSEVNAALRLGHAWTKAFPAAQLGQGWAKALKGPFPAARFVAVGGVSADNAASFLRGGYDAIGVGSAFADPAQTAALMAALGRSQGG